MTILRVGPGDPFSMAAHDTADTRPHGSEAEASGRLETLLDRIEELSDRLAAEQERAVLVVLQGFDGAGKDHVIKTVMRAVDPAELHVFSFNAPVGAEVLHDPLWRFHQQAPELGRIHVFDRSYYEEVISAWVHELIDDEERERRCESIRDFERLLHRHGTTIVKLLLHVSKDVQAERVRERLSDPTKQHEFAAADVKDRDLWDRYDAAYDHAVAETATEDAPWHVVPADHRWYAAVASAEVLAGALEALDPQYPGLDPEELEEAGIDADDR
jgi:PPK2 family polyphosphate:nucleotide phosphotransferase